MADIATWGWYTPTTWPGFSPADQDNLDSSGNGRSVDPAGYVEFTMRDADGDGIIYDHDSDDVAPADYSEYVFGPTLTLHPQEIALYTNSTVVISGVAHTGLGIQVTLFDDGSWGARLMDYSIPAGLHHSDVDSITLGAWDGVEYDGIHTANVDDPFVCFAAATRVATPAGLRRVGDLQAGDMVETRNHGPQPVLWVGRRRVAARGRHAPWIVAAGSFGAHGRLMLSTQHRLLLTLPGERGGKERLCAVKHLAWQEGARGIRRQSFPGEITYVHLLLPRHGLLWAEGLWAESLWPGPEAEAALDAAAYGALAALGVEGKRLARNYGPKARPVLKRREALELLARHGSPAALIRAAELPGRAGVPGPGNAETAAVAGQTGHGANSAPVRGAIDPGALSPAGR